MPNYIQKFATIEQSCDWLRARTGGVWTLPRLLECHLKPYFWLDYKPGYEELFGGRVEGYRTWMIFAGDVQRLEFDGTSALVNMIAAPDGTPVLLNPGWVLPLTELRFKREALERVATILEGKAGQQAAATSGTPEKAAAPVHRGGVTKREILCIDWPMPAEAPPLENILDEIPKWVDAACKKIGAPGKGAAGSHLWNPAILAVCLSTKTPQKKWGVGEGTLTNFLRLHFSDYLQEWIDATGQGI